MYFLSLLLLVGLGPVSAKVQFLGVNIAGFEFGCGIDGSCPISQSQGPLTSLGGGDGAGQMQHFATDDQMNIFRLPVSWQFLVNDKLGGALDANNFGKYDQLMQVCLATGASCAIDLHNFARYNGQIIGQSAGGVTDAQFADLWVQLANKYKGNTKVIFGLMNEPHDLDVPLWAATCQAVVTAVRNAGAKNMILLPGTNFASAGQFVSSGSAAELIKIKNPDGTTDGLILDLHKYLDVDNSGSHSTCTTDNIGDAFAIAADFLRTNGRQGLVSETGAGTDASCFTNFCAQNAFLNQNSDVFLGYIAWAAGSFATSYILSLTPTKQSGKYVDKALASQCVLAPWLNSGSATATTSVGASSTAVESLVVSQAPGATRALSTPVAGEVTTASGKPTKTLTLTSTSSKIVATITRTFSATLTPSPSSSFLSASASMPVAESSEIASPSSSSSSGMMTVGGTLPWSNGTASATSAIGVASSGTLVPTATGGGTESGTGTGVPQVVVGSGGVRGMGRLVWRLLGAGVVVALWL